jgi:DNA-binding NtrC family response regulator
MGDPRLVLVVDDNEAMRRVLARVMGWRGFEPMVFADAASALEAIMDMRPLVITVDYDLGGATGLDLARSVEQKLGSDAPPMILVSAVADRIPAADRARFAAVHSKPFRASALLDDVERLAQRSERKRSGVRAISTEVGRRRNAKGE